MLSNVLSLSSYNQTLVEENNYLYLNDTPIEINVKRGFSDTEFNEIHRMSKMKKRFMKLPLEYFENLSNLTCKEQRRYAFLLAFYRRIDLDMNNLFSAPISPKSFPYENCPNFEKLEEIFERYYSLFEPHKKDNEKLKRDFKSKSLIIVLKLWLSGYGLFPGYTQMHITNEFLHELRDLKLSPSTGMTKFIRFISFALSQEKESPVDKVVKLKEVQSLYEREVGKWNADLAHRSSSELGLELKNFVLNQLYTRANGPLIQEYFVDGETNRVTYNEIAHSTFAAYSSALRAFYLLAEEKNITTINQLLTGELLPLLAYARNTLDNNSFSTAKIAIRFWLLWHKNQNNLNYNIDRICPPEASNKTTSFGKVLEISPTITLLSALLDDALPFYNDISLTDYRCRYVCLIMLSTGQRVTEVCMLKYDCLKSNKDSDMYLDIHKTKTGKGNIVIATPDVIHYVEKLRAVAPKLKLHFSSAKYKGADDLNTKRLVANKFNHGPLTDDSVKKFLHRLQQYLFPEQPKPLFSPHDFRRIKATYMSLVGYSNQDIKKQLGQSNINSQIPYLQTKPLSHQKYFEEILHEGVYEITDNDDVIVDTDRVIKKARELITDDKKVPKHLIQLLLDNVTDVNNISLSPIDVATLESTGFPVGLFSCSASNITVCNNSPINCFPCAHYVPEEDSLDNHIIEIFRYMILVKYQANSLKNTKDIVVKTIVTEKNKHIEQSISDAFDKLFTKFNLVESDILQIKLDLDKHIKSYSRKHLKKIPVPSFVQAKNFIERGEL